MLGLLVSPHTSPANTNNEQDFGTSLVFFTNDGGEFAIHTPISDFIVIVVTTHILRKHHQ
jgi:hypothetical protein